MMNGPEKSDSAIVAMKPVSRIGVMEPAMCGVMEPV